MSNQRYFSIVHVRTNLGKQLQDMSDQNTVLPDILTDETKIFILSTKEVISDSLYNQQFSCSCFPKFAGKVWEIQTGLVLLQRRLY